MLISKNRVTIIYENSARGKYVRVRPRARTIIAGRKNQRRVKKIVISSKKKGEKRWPKFAAQPRTCAPRFKNKLCF